MQVCICNPDVGFYFAGREWCECQVRHVRRCMPSWKTFGGMIVNSIALCFLAHARHHRHEKYNCKAHCYHVLCWYRHWNEMISSVHLRWLFQPFIPMATKLRARYCQLCRPHCLSHCSAKSQFRQYITGRSWFAAQAILCLVSLSMQVNSSPRRTDGIGRADGEGCERFWAYLRQFSCISKEMSPSHRIDLLTDATIYYARRKLEIMGQCEYQRSIVVITRPINFSQCNILPATPA